MYEIESSLSYLEYYIEYRSQTGSESEFFAHVSGNHTVSVNKERLSKSRFSCFLQSIIPVQGDELYHDPV
jgi:hypothetical protein